MKKFFTLLYILSLLTLAVYLSLDFQSTLSISPDTWIEVYVTGYSREQGYIEKTFLGTLAGWGTCAVDPKVFPFGSVFYVPEYGAICGRYAIALDTGSAVKGYHIDLWTETNQQAYSLTGMKKVRVLRWGWTNWLVEPKEWGL